MANIHLLFQIIIISLNHSFLVLVQVNKVQLIIKLETLSATVTIDGRVGEYYTDDTTVYTKIPTRLIDTPQAITSVSPQLILDSAATDADDVYRYSAGVSDSTYSAVTFRGFTQRETLF